MKGIEGWFSQDEGRWYAKLARGVVGGTFVEVGSWKGRSTSFIGRICNTNGTRLICVDHWSGSSDSLSTRYASVLANENVEQTFQANMKALGIRVETIRDSSVRAAARFEPGSVDCVFLDGSHDSASVMEDLIAWSDRLSPTGVLAGHDYSTKHLDLCATVDTFCRERGLRVRRGPRSVYALEPDEGAARSPPHPR